MRCRAVLTTGVVAVSLVATALPAEAITKTEARALAKAGALTAKDLPGFSAERNTVDPGDAADDAAFYACLGVKEPTYLAKNEGFEFRKGDATALYSTAYVVSTVKKAKSDMEVQATEKAVECTKQTATAIWTRQGYEIQSLSLTPVVVKLSNADATYGQRYDVRATLRGIAARFRILDVVVLVGQTELRILAADLAGRAPKLSKSLRLAAMVAERVRAL